jgi:ribonuclease BN (tRNA processing enzyme)
MRGTYVADVGDGLCMAISTIFGDTIQIDCGNHDERATAFHGLERIYNRPHFASEFILSHFHVDHYNGLIYMSENFLKCPYFGIEEVCYPRKNLFWNF